jgi:hypothetical protein
MSTLKELTEIGERMGLKGPDLKLFVEEQKDKQAYEKEKDRVEREIERVEKEKEREFKLKEQKLQAQEREADSHRAMELQLRMKQLELDNQIKIKEMEAIERDKEIDNIQQRIKGTSQVNSKQSSKHNSEAESDGDGDGGLSEHERTGERRSNFGRLPKLPAFEESKDDLDAYLLRFERYAQAMGWKETEWTMSLSALLKGKALEAYARLPMEDIQNYGKLKLALLRRFELTEEGFKKKFHSAKRENGESPKQFVTRLRNYLDRWLSTAKAGAGEEAVKSFWVREQYLSTCDKDLATFLRERAPTDLESLTKLAEQYLDARGGDEREKRMVYQRTTVSKEVNQQPEKWSPGRQKFKGNTTKERRDCFVCGKIGHLAKDCRLNVKAAAFNQTSWKPRSFGQNRERKQNTYEDLNQKHRSTEEQSREQQQQFECKAHSKVDCKECLRIKQTEHTCGLLARPEIELKCGCKIPVLACDRQLYHGTLKTVDGRVEGQKVKVLKDSGCSTIVVKRSLVREENITDNKVICVMIDGTAKEFPIAEVEIETPYLSGTVAAVCMERPMYDLIIGDLDNSRTHVIKGSSVQGQAVVTRAQEKKEKKKEAVLKVLKEVDVSLTTKELIELQQNDESLQRFREVLKQQKSHTGNEEVFEKQGILFRRKNGETGQVFTQLLVPGPLREKVLKLAHDQALGGHLGRKKTLERIQPHFHWVGMQGDVERWCRSCDACQRMEQRGKTKKVPLGVMPIIDTPFKRVAVDLIGPILPVTGRGNRYILTLVDYATRWPEAVALKNIETTTVAEALVEMFTRIGVPEEWLSDQGSQFTSGVMREVGRLLSMDHLFSSPYNPKCNGLVERLNGTIKSMLRKVCREKPQDWDRYLPAVLFAMREVPQESLGFSSFELVYGREVRGPMKILKELWTKETADEGVKTLYQYVVDLKERLQETCELAHKELKRHQQKQKTWYDKKARQRSLVAGDKVLLLLPTDHNKLTMAWKGPFAVVKKISDTDYLIQMAAKVKVFHINMLKKYVERQPKSEEISQMEIIEMGAIVEWEEEDCRDLLQLQKKETYEDVKVNPNLENSIQEKVRNLLKEFEDIFSDVPGKSKIGEHRIYLTTDEPVRSRAYPVPYALREKLDKELDEMERLGIIERSEATYASPIVVVEKPDSGMRVCADFRKLNGITVMDPEPMVTAEDIFSQLSGDKIFSKFDMSKGFWQIPMRESDKDLTTIVTHRGLYRFCYMPFGLVGAPATYTRVMRQLLKTLTGVHNYMDDCLAHSPQWNHHLEALRQFFQKVREAGLTLRPSKCEIGFETVSFLGFSLSKDGLHPQNEKIEKITNAPRPKTKRQLRSFLGLVSYYRSFVPRFSECVADLVALTKKGAPNILIWQEVHEVAFNLLKSLLSKTPILRLANVHESFIVQTDASDVGLGAALMQEYDGIRHPIAFASKLLSEQERRYATVEKECYAIKWALQKFENYLFGKTFVLETDHAPLQYLNKAKYQNSRLMRWAMCIQPFNYFVKYIRGSENVCADYMSRMSEDTYG